MSSFYISNAIGFIVNAIYTPLRVELLVYILYFITLFFILFGQIFLVLFNLLLLKRESQFSTKKILIIIFFYAVIIFSILILPGGFVINKDTNWRPVWSWWFFIILYIFVTCVIVLPFTVLTLKLYKIFEDIDLKKRLKWLYIGFLGITISFYGGLIYITWNDSVFRMTWSIVAIFIAIGSGCIIYYAWGRTM